MYIIISRWFVGGKKWWSCREVQTLGVTDVDVLAFALGEHDMFLRPYDGDDCGTHGDPSIFHAALDRDYGHWAETLG